VVKKNLTVPDEPALQGSMSWISWGANQSNVSTSSISSEKNLSAPLTPAQKRLRKSQAVMAKRRQSELAKSSLRGGDMAFAGNDSKVREELVGFRQHISKTAGDPLKHYKVLDMLGKGTAGWVFEVEHKETGARLAMKLVRLTNAETAMKEWYVSKVLRQLGVDDVVLTAEDVYVLKREGTDPLIEEALANAGPVPFYVCCLQELMPWGCLEDEQLPAKCLFQLFAMTARALATMHANRLQHGDVKPENIMLVRSVNLGGVTSSKLCDLGSATVGDDKKALQNDTRRFGVTVFAAATGENWTQKRLIHEEHDALVERLKAHLAGSEAPALQRLPEVVRQILDGKCSMAEVATIMQELLEESSEPSRANATQSFEVPA